ncbi:glycosyltransferase [Candidatus Villigracilis saccharophilus]|uniref:glycosyltransferase n=1 Tax=Candidatus Villigracilis saccharophilus TaxID=3140684 RepID=UPI0031368612|nr:glycosyltransferase [Anaerolineales bacterium]
MNNKIRILIISEGFGKELYGVSHVILKLNEWLRSHDVVCRILVVNVGDISDIEVDIKKIPVNSFRNPFQWHPGLYRFFVNEMVGFEPDVVHVHGVFTFVQRMAVKAAQTIGIPVLLSLHGMLDDWIWKQKGLLYAMVKRVYWYTLMFPVFKKVAYIHVITKMESEVATYELPKIPQILIPNAIDFFNLPKLGGQPQKVFLFLGRLHPVKGVDLLINAFYRANLQNDWRLVIAGPDYDPEYGRQLRQQARNLELGDRVQFIGPVYGSEKYSLLQNAWVVVVPSFSEVISMVNLEASALFTPTITTYATGLHDWEQGGGLRVDSNEDQLSQALAKTASWSLSERLRYGEQARQFVKNRYGWDTIGQKWLAAYQLIKLS